MQFNCEKEYLQRALFQCQGIIPIKPSIPILSNIHLSIKDDDLLYLTTTNLEISLKCRLKVNVIEKGEIIVSNKRLFDIIREAPKENIFFNLKDRELNISYGRTSYKLNCIMEEEFPSFPEVNREDYFIINSTQLKEMIRKVIFAISLDSFRYILNGVYISIKDKKMEMVATDGYRLAIIEDDLIEAKSNIEAIIPSKTLQELSKILEDDKEISIFVEDKQITFQGDDFILSSKLVEGTYPNFRELIPTENKNILYINRRDFLDACRRMSIISNDQLIFNISSNNLTISSQVSEVGSCKEDLEVKYEGEDLRISFNYKYLMDVLKNIEKEEICLALKDEKSAGLLNINNYKYVIMPMRIKVD